MEPKTYIDFKDREYGGKDKFANFDDVDTIIPHGGGLESMAALAWAVDTGRKPLVWTDLIADRPGTHNLVLGARKSSMYFKVPFILSTNTIPMKSINIPAGFINIDNVIWIGSNIGLAKFASNNFEHISNNQPIVSLSLIHI